MRSAVVGVLTLALVIVGGGYAVSRATEGRGNHDTGKVVRVVDGDTVEVRLKSNGETHRVRLLNIDTPETKHPDLAVQCLGPEATRFLEGLLAPGDTVRLDYDVDRRDGYGRTLAAVSKDNADISTRIAEAGFGVAIKIGANTRHYPPVKEAEDRARKAGKGLFSPELQCALPVKLAALEVQVANLPETPAAEADLDVLIGVAAAVSAEAAVLDETLKTVKTGGDITRVLRVAYSAPALQKRLDRAARRASAAHTELTAEKEKRAEAAEEAARKKKAAEDAARKKKAAEDAARKKKAAEEAALKKVAQEQARRAAQESAARRASQARREARRPAENTPRTTTTRTSAPRRTTPTPPRTRTPERPSTRTPGTKYTGPRCYAPGGKTWKPCPSKG